MISELNIISDNLWSIYSIEKAKKIKIHFEDATIEEKERCFISFNLDQEFFSRLNRDPGLYLAVLNELEVSVDSIEKAKNVIIKSIGKNFDFIHSELKISQDKRLNSINSGSIVGRKNEPSSILEEFNCNNYNDRQRVAHKKVLEFLKLKLEDAKKRKDFDEINIINSIIPSMNSETDGNFNFLVSDSLYQYENLNEKITTKLNEFIHKKYRYKLPSGYPKGNLPGSGDHDYSLISIIPHKNKKIIEILQFLGMAGYSTVVHIAADIWFNQFDVNKKTEFLNREFPFNIEECFSLPNLDYSEEIFYNLSEVAIFMGNMGYYDDPKFVFQFILNHTKDPFLKLKCAYGLENLFFRYDEFEESLRFCEICLENLTEIPKNRLDKKIDKFCLLIDTGKNHYKMGKADLAKSVFSQAKRRIQQFQDGSPILKIRILLKLAEGYEISNDEKEEIEVRKKILDLADKNGMHRESHSSLRLVQLLGIKISTALDDREFCDIIKNRHETFKKHAKIIPYLERATSSMLSYQFSRSRKWLDLSWCMNPNDEEAFFIAKATFIIGDTDSARDRFLEIYNKRTEFSSKIELYTMLSIIYFIKNEKSDGLFFLNLCLNELSNKKEYSKIFETMIEFVYNITRLDDELKILHMFETLENELNKRNVEELPSESIGKAFLDCSCISEAHHFFDRSLSNEISNERRAEILMYKSMAFASYDEIEKANDFIERAISCNPKNPAIWYQKAIFSKKSCDFVNSLQSINYARILDPQNQDYLKLGKQLEQLAKISINFQGISDPDIKKTFETAERLILQFFDSPSTDSQLDLSPVIIMYGKGLEKLVNQKIVSNLRENIYKKFPTPKNTPFWNGKKKEVSPLPSRVKKIFDENRKIHTLMLGEWAGLKNDFLRTKNNKILYEIEKYLYSHYEFDPILDACYYISPQRNEAAHDKVLTLEDVKEIRENVIQHLNTVIKILN